MEAVTTQSRRFVRGAVLLAAAGILSRVLGFYRLLLPGLIGAEGVGLYHMAYPIYAAVVAVATGGLPVAVSRLVAERAAVGDEAGARRVLRVSLAFLGPLGLGAAALLFALAPAVAAGVAHEPRATLSIRALAPAIVLVALASGLRGYFQGLQDMMPTAFSQLVEQVVRVATILPLVVLLRPLGVAAQAAGATFGAVTGAVAALAVLVGLYLMRPRPAARPKSREPFGRIVARLVSFAVPVAVAGVMPSLMQLVDLAVVPGRLAAQGLASGRRTALYGELAGYALPVANLPAILTLSLAAAVIPAIAEADAQGNGREVVARARLAVRVGAMVALPAATGLLLMPDRIMGLLFGAPAVGGLLASLAPSVAFLGVNQTLSAVLQGAGDPATPVRSLAWAVLLKAVTTWLLVPVFGAAGAGYATSAAYLLAAVLNARALARRLPGAVGLGDLVAPAGGLGLLALTVWFGGEVVGPGRVGTVAIVVAAAVSYAVGLLLTGAVGPEEVALLPGGGRFRRRLGVWRRRT